MHSVCTVFRRGSQYPSTPQVIVFGGGPAGWALAGALALRGADVEIVDPAPDTPFRATYGGWVDLTPEQYRTAFRAVYTDPRVTFVDGSVRRIGAAYGRFDTERLHRLLVERASTAGVRVTQGTVTDFVDDGRIVCVDAMGAGSPRRRSVRAPFYQTALGIWARVSGEVFAAGQMSLMDLRASTASVPTFLYGMRESMCGSSTEDWVFLQETSLVARGVVSFVELESALRNRLSAMGIAIIEECGREHCVIPMGGGLVASNNNWLSFGAAAGLVQPASGYQLGLSLTLADEVAQAICSTSGEATAQAVAGAAKVRSRDRAFAWALYEHGASVLSQMSSPELSEFMQLFFGLDPMRATAFLDGRLSAFGVAASMLEIFRGATPSMKRHLMGFNKSWAPPRAHDSSIRTKGMTG